MVAILEPYEVWESRIPDRRNAVSRSLWKTSGCSLLFLLRLDLILCPSDSLPASTGPSFVLGHTGRGCLLR